MQLRQVAIMLTSDCLFQKNSVFIKEIDWLKPNSHFSKLFNANIVDFNGNKDTILGLTSAHFPLYVLSEKLHFLEISPVRQKLWSFKCTMLNTLNSNFLK